jgi:hypothetical protein
MSYKRIKSRRTWCSSAFYYFKGGKFLLKLMFTLYTLRDICVMVLINDFISPHGLFFMQYIQNFLRLFLHGRKDHKRCDQISEKYRYER